MRYGCAIWCVVLSGIMLLLSDLSKGWVSDIRNLSVVHGEKGGLGEGEHSRMRCNGGRAYLIQVPTRDDMKGEGGRK
jgi:hypothetical protein